MRKTLMLIQTILLCSLTALTQTNLISPTADGGFENATNTFAANGWTVVNDTYNNFYVGSAPLASDGLFCAFTGSNASTWTGTPDVSISHFYKDITFGSETGLNISFKFKTNPAENWTDYFSVSLVSTATTPVAGTELLSGQIFYDYYSADWVLYSIPVSAAEFGTSARLVFSWVTETTEPNEIAFDEISVSSYPPLSGTKTVPGDYATIADAVNDLNFKGIGTGGVTFNIAANYTETITSPIILHATGTELNPIVFQKSGIGANPLLTAFAGTSGVDDSQCDGLWMLAGSDYVTIDGIDLFDPNTTSPQTMEYGYSMCKGFNSENNRFDGCQFNTIKNCTLTLSRNNYQDGIKGSCAILIAHTLWDSPGYISYADINESSETHSYNEIFSNTIQNCNHGIYIYGSALSSGGGKGNGKSLLQDSFNDIGGSSVSTGNTILNFGGATGTNYPSSGITFINQDEINISNNTINNNNGSGVNHTNINRGIYGIETASSEETFNTTISYNSITIHGGATIRELTGINLDIDGTSTVLNIHHNNITGDYTTATSGYFYGILSMSAVRKVMINNNTVSDFTFGSASTATNGGFYGIGITSTSVPDSLFLSNNVVDNLFRHSTVSGLTYGMIISAGTIRTISGNTISNINTDAPGNLFGISSTGSTSTELSNNQIYNINNNLVSSTSTLYGISATASSANFNNNIIHDLTHDGTGDIRGFYENGSNNGTHLFSSNQIYNLTGNGTIFGAWMSDQNITFSNNLVYNLQSNMTTQTFRVYGYYLFGIFGTATIYNNRFGDLKAPSATSFNEFEPTIYGMYLRASNANTSINFDFNSIYLQANSSGTTFTTAALYVEASATATTCNLNLRNNIIINKSTPVGAGKSYAMYRSWEEYGNYNVASNNNLFYAGTPGSSNLIYGSNTITKETLDDFKTLVAPRESNSITENLSFLSLDGSNSDFLHINPEIVSTTNNAGIAVTGITTDADGQTRNATTPDIGADEYDPSLVWTGATSTDWATAGNWNWNLAPTENNSIIITDVANDPIINELAATPAICNDLTINSNAVLTINTGKALTVNGSITNNAGNNGIIIQSDVSGSGSLIHNTNNVGASIQRYITGGPLKWHIISSPVSAQSISGDWTPSGTLGDGTGYDFYAYDEASATWLNQKIIGNNIHTFQVGKGYLIDYQSANSSKTFVGYMNNSTNSLAISANNTGEYAGINLLGNPYPSSIDWKAASGWTRTNLVQNSGGYDVYVWNQEANNYGTYNSAAAGDEGTNAASRYIAPMQGFFVEAASSGNVILNNSVRVHNNASNWHKNQVTIANMKITVNSETYGSDEALIEFGHTENAGGANKLFSFVPTAPSIYLPKEDHNYSILFQAESTGNELIPVNFIPGADGNYTLTFHIGLSIAKLELEDMQTGIKHNLLDNPTYSFTSTIADSPERFLLHFGVVGVEETFDRQNLRLHYSANSLYITNENETANLNIYNLIGQHIYATKVRSKGLIHINIPLPDGTYIVCLQGENTIQSAKLIVK